MCTLDAPQALLLFISPGAWLCISSNSGKPPFIRRFLATLNSVELKQREKIFLELEIWGI